MHDNTDISIMSDWGRTPQTETATKQTKKQTEAKQCHNEQETANNRSKGCNKLHKCTQLLWTGVKCVQQNIHVTSTVYNDANSTRSINYGYISDA